MARILHNCLTKLLSCSKELMLATCLALPIYCGLFQTAVFPFYNYPMYIHYVNLHFRKLPRSDLFRLAWHEPGSGVSDEIDLAACLPPVMEKTFSYTLSLSLDCAETGKPCIGQVLRGASAALRAGRDCHRDGSWRLGLIRHRWESAPWAPLPYVPVSRDLLLVEEP